MKPATLARRRELGRRLPDFLLIGAPKAGSTALHDALATHPQLHASPIKEPKYFLTGGVPPTRGENRGPGDAHSAREWVWRWADYERLFSGAPTETLTFESTPFYLWNRASHARIAAALPHAKLIAVIRDPIDRAFSNWTHLRADGLEPEADFLNACRLEPARAQAGWAPFWRYLELGRYGGQLQHLFSEFNPAQVLVVRYRDLIDAPGETLDGVCRYVGVDTGVLGGLPDSNLGRWAGDSAAHQLLRRVVRAGAAAGSLADPRLWRKAERPLRTLLQRGDLPRPRLDPAVRAELIPHFRDDVALLSRLLGDDYDEWLADEGLGAYAVRKS